MGEKRYALLIASSEFPDEPLFQALRCPEKDVDGLEEVLVSEVHGPYTEVAVLKNRPHHEVLFRMNRILGQAERDDLVLIYYSGHGKLNRAGQLHLAAQDTVLNALESTSIPITRVRDLVDVSACNRVILMLDCCFSGAAGTAFARGSVDDQLQLAAAGRGTYIVSASTGIQVALEKEGEQYGAFTKHVIEGIREGRADANSDGLVDMDELYKYVHDKVLEEGSQEPMRWNLNVRGQMFIARSGKTPREERRQEVRQYIYNLAEQGILPDGVVRRALEVAASPVDALSEVEREQDALLDRLVQHKIPTGDFLEEWYRLAFQGSVPAVAEVKEPPPVIPVAQEPKTVAPPSPDVHIELSTSQLDIVPGETASVEVEIINTGDAGGRLKICVDGMSDRWYDLSEPWVQLGPHAQSTVKLTVHPPMSSELRAGRHDLAVRLVSETDPPVESVARFIVDIQRYLDFDVALEPAKTRGRKGRYKLRVGNRGNVPTTYTPTGEDQEGQLRFEFQPHEMMIAPGEQHVFNLVVTPCAKLWYGKPVDYEFEVSVSSHASPQGETKRARGSLQHIPLLTLPMLGAAGAGLMAVIIYFGVGSSQHWPPFASLPTPTPTPWPTATPTPTSRPPTPTATPTVAVSTATPTKTPTATPTPTQKPNLVATPRPTATPTPTPGETPKPTPTPTWKATPTPTPKPTATPTPMLPSPTPSPLATPMFVLKWGSQGSLDGQFRWPLGVAVDEAGYVYVADLENHRIQKFTSSGTFVTKWGSAGSGDGQFQYPVAVAVDVERNVYVADQGNHRIQKFTSSGTFVTKWGSAGSGDGQFQAPRGVVVGGSGIVYVVDGANHRIQKFTSDGAFLAKWGSGGSGDGQFQWPYGVAVVRPGDVCVVDGANHRIQKFTSDGAFLTKWGSEGSGDGQFQGPFGVAVDAVGNVYVADGGNHRIQVFTSDGAFLTKWGSQGTGDGQFWDPFGVAVDGMGNVYVADQNNHRIQKFAH